MQFLTLISVSAVLFGAHALPTVESARTIESLGLPKGYTLVDLPWTMNLPDRTVYNGSGTVEKAITELEATYPNLKSFLEEEAESVPKHAGIEKRAIVTRIDCNPRPDLGWGVANWGTIQNGIRYLRGLGGGPNMPPRSCSRVSCSYNAAIFLCNDNNGQTGIQSWAWPADVTQAIENQCLGTRFDVGYKGQGFEVGNWNVIVRYDRC